MNDSVRKKATSGKPRYPKNSYTAPKVVEMDNEEPEEMMQINFDPENTIKVEEGLVNAYGLDLTNPDNIKFEYGNILFEVIGGVKDLVLAQLKVTLKVSKKGSSSPMEILRIQQIDLFNDGHIKYNAQRASERIKVENTRITEAIYELTSRLEHYRNDMLQGSGNKEPSKRQSTTGATSAKNFLKQEGLLEELKTELLDVGIADGELALKLFLLGITRKTATPLHVIVQGKLLLANELFKSYCAIVPTQDLKEVTSISNNALTYTPYPDYWRDKTLIVHQLDGVLNQESMLLEYMEQGKLRRIVTQASQHRNYTSDEKNIEESFNVMGYTSKEFHPVFNAANVVCLELGNTAEIQQQLYDREIRQFAGMIDTVQQQERVELLRNIQRYLKPIKVANPYLDQIDLQGFFGKDLKSVRLFLQITNLITLLHQEQVSKKKEDGVLYIEVAPAHMLSVLELFRCLWLQEEEALYFRVQSTLASIKKQLKEQHGDNYVGSKFKVKELRPKEISFSTFSKHVRVLENYNRIKRVGGTNRDGYEYEVVSWDEKNDKVEQYNKLIEQVEKLK